MEVILINPLSLFGRSIGFRFDNYAWIMMCEVNGIEFHQIGELQEDVMLVTLCYGAYVSNCRFNALKEKLTLDAFYKLYKKFTLLQVDELKMAIYKSKLLGKTMQEWAEVAETEKKK